ncbi:MAG: DUF4097 family beta strand repeat-containing protein [Acidobacteriota bacterium]
MKYIYLLLLFVICIPANNINGQDKEKNREFCQNYSNWGSRPSFNEVREMNMSKPELLTVDGKQNGGIKIIGENRSDVLVRACVQTWGDSENEVRSLAQGIKIQTGSVVQAESSAEKNWSVSYQILVPRNTNLKLTAHNGGISISNVEGNMDFATQNGGIGVTGVAGNVKGRTQNGGVNAKLDGKSWKGAGLDLETKNGGINLNLPENYAARLETATVNGGFKSDLELTVKLKEFRRGVNINTDINGGGAPIRIVTTNGGVRINAQK